MKGSPEDALKAIWSCRGDNFLQLVEAAGLDPGSDFRGADLRKMDLSNLDLAGFDFSGADFRDSDLTGADLRAAITTGAVFGASFERDSPAEFSDEDNSRVEELIKQASLATHAPERLKALRELTTLPIPVARIEDFLEDRIISEKSYRALDIALKNFSTSYEESDFVDLLYSGLYRNNSSNAKKRLFLELGKLSRHSLEAFSEYCSFATSNPHPFFQQALENLSQNDRDFNMFIENVAAYCKTGNDYRSSRQLLSWMYDDVRSREYAIRAAAFLANNRIIGLKNAQVRNFEFNLLSYTSFEILLNSDEYPDRLLVHDLGYDFFSHYKYCTARIVEEDFLSRISNAGLHGDFAFWMLLKGEGAGHHHLLQTLLGCSRSDAMAVAREIIRAREKLKRGTRAALTAAVLEATEQNVGSFRQRSLVHQLASILS